MRNLSVIYLADKKSNLNAKTVGMAYKLLEMIKLFEVCAIQCKTRAYYFNFPQ